MIWVVGACGMLGSDLVAMLRGAGLDVLATDAECDVRSTEALKAAAHGMAIDWVINCCAYTKVDEAEDHKTAAYALNADGPANVAEIARTLGARMIHISTDYVFDGTSHRPYLETDPVSPVGVYASSKAEGEKAVLRASPDNYVLRTAWLYGEHGRNFVHTMLQLMQERDSISVVSDQSGSPTWTKTVCRVIIDLVGRGDGPGGIYHVTSQGVTNWYDFARTIQNLAIEQELIDRPCEITPVTTADYPTAAPRPAYSVLSCQKIMALLGTQLPSWQESLAAYMSSPGFGRGLPPTG